MVVVDDLHIVYRVYGAGGDRGTAASALLRILGRKVRGSIREVHAIRGVSFVAYRGDAVGVIGRNGSGKSALLRAIAGLLPAEQGNVYTTGEASLLGVNAALLDDLTGERNVTLGCLAMGMTKQEAREKYDAIVSFSGVGDFIDLPMKTTPPAWARGCGSPSPPRRATTCCSWTRRWPPVTPNSGSRATPGSSSCARRPAPSSWSRTTWRRSS